MKATISHQENQEKEDRSCINCKYSKPDTLILAGMFPSGPVFMPVPVQNCECERVQTGMLELALHPGKLERHIQHRSMLIFPVDVVNLAVCQGKHFEKREEI